MGIKRNHYPEQLKRKAGNGKIKIIDRDDQIVNLCEIKYTPKPYEISKEEWRKLNHAK